MQIGHCPGLPQCFNRENLEGPVHCQEKAHCDVVVVVLVLPLHSARPLATRYTCTLGVKACLSADCAIRVISEATELGLEFIQVLSDFSVPCMGQIAGAKA